VITAPSLRWRFASASTAAWCLGLYRLVQFMETVVDKPSKAVF
jgi:hypothetical protein